MVKYLLLILMPSSILQWLLLIACVVGGWFLFSTRFETSKKSAETVNIWGAVFGVALFYGLKNGLGGLGDMFMSLSGTYVDGYPHPQVPLINAFVAIPRIFVSILCLSFVYGLYQPVSKKEDEDYEKQRQQDEAKEAEQSLNQTIDQIGSVFNLIKAEPGQPNYHGYRLVNDDNGGQPDTLWNTMTPTNIQQARNQFRLYGNPGGGLSQSDFSKNEIQSGQKGEQILANMITGNCLNVVSFWSLHGLDKQRRFTDADIDCVIAGQDMQGKTHLWFVDAKNYKGNADTAYRNLTSDQLLRISIGQHAFETGVDGRPDLKLSSNMNWQRDMWASVFHGKPVEVEWLVCMVPTSDKGVPDVNGVMWPGNIPCVTPEELVRRVNAVGLDSVQNIPLDWLDMFKRQLKK